VRKERLKTDVDLLKSHDHPPQALSLSLSSYDESCMHAYSV
jgi:hypothetical protein